MKKTIALILVALIIALTLTGCSKPIYSSGATHKSLNCAIGDKPIKAMVESDKLFFDKNDVNLDFYYCFYCLDDETMEQCKDYYCFIPSQSQLENGYFYSESAFAIYISNNEKLIFEEDENVGLTDYENKVNAKLVKFISFKEAFEKDYGFTTTGFSKVDYHHNEKLIFPVEVFDSSTNYIYIHVVELRYAPEKNTYSDSKASRYTVSIKYKLLGDNTVVLFNE